MKRSIFLFLPAVLLPLLVGGLSAYLTSGQMEAYQSMPKPPLAPPAALFPIAWTILYVLMGVASYLVLTKNSTRASKSVALFWYLIQLVMNFFWSIIFFRLGWYGASFIWLLVMFIAIIICTADFFLVSRTAGWLMIPYNLWMVFAGYLNWFIAFINS